MVSRLQAALNAGRGDFAPSSGPVLATDGSYGPLTASAVQGTQKLAAVAADGVVGLQTWALPVHAAGQELADLCGVPAPRDGGGAPRPGLAPWRPRAPAGPAPAGLSGP